MPGNRAAGVESGFLRDGRPQEMKNAVQSTLNALTGKVAVVEKGGVKQKTVDLV